MYVYMLRKSDAPLSSTGFYQAYGPGGPLQGQASFSFGGASVLLQMTVNMTSQVVLIIATGDAVAVIAQSEIDIVVEGASGNAVTIPPATDVVIVGDYPLVNVVQDAASVLNSALDGTYTLPVGAREAAARLADVTTGSLSELRTLLNQMRSETQRMAEADKSRDNIAIILAAATAALSIATLPRVKDSNVGRGLRQVPSQP